MSLDYSAIQKKLEMVKSEIDELISYTKTYEQTDNNDIGVYTKLANISSNVLQCDRLSHPIQSEVKCTCGECEQENQYYECEGCKRIVPWCFGAADKYFDYCDDCAAKLSAQDEPEPVDEKILEILRISKISNS